MNRIGVYLSNQSIPFRYSLEIAVQILLLLANQNFAFATQEQTGESFTAFEEGVTIKYPSNWELSLANHSPADSFKMVMGFYSPLESDSDPFQEFFSNKSRKRQHL